MNFKEKLLTQTVICMTAVALIRGTTFVQNDYMNKAKEYIENGVKTDYSAEELQEKASHFAQEIVNSPRKLENIVQTAGEMSYYSYPMDEDSGEKILDVRASYGGEVIYAGIDEKLGVCIRIKHSNKISTYGNLNTINVIIGERVNKSEIIGTYDSESGKEFYYQLEDDMV